MNRQRAIASDGTIYVLDQITGLYRPEEQEQRISRSEWFLVATVTVYAAVVIGAVYSLLGSIGG